MIECNAGVVFEFTETELGQAELRNEHELGHKCSNQRTQMCIQFIPVNCEVVCKFVHHVACTHSILVTAFSNWYLVAL